MIEFSRDSWHYRLVNRTLTTQYPSRSLCIYFWQIVWSLTVKGFHILKWPVPIMMVGVGAIFIFWPELLPGFIGYDEDNKMIFEYLSWFYTMGGICFIMAGMAVVAITVFFTLLGIGMFIRTVINAIKDSRPETEEPNVMVEYLKAKKERICPMIKFVSKDEMKVYNNGS